jgi:uncharacterized protein
VHPSLARLAALVPFLLVACESPPPATPSAAPRTAAVTPLVVGETLAVDSKVLGEKRVVNVYLPPGYAESKEPVPVLYMPDGGLGEDFHHVMGLVDIGVKNGTMRPFLLVGVENTERRRDLVGPSAVPDDLAIAPHAGGADRFRRFLREELKPAVAARYRVTKESAIVGESFAGLFVLETLLLDPELFDTYIAISPSTWWNHAALVRGAEAKLAAWKVPGKTLFLANAEEDAEMEGAGLLVTALKARPAAGLAFHHAPMPEEKHATIYHPAALRAFRAVLAPRR